MSGSKYTSLKVETTGSVATLSLNRPEIRNAFDASMIRELKSAFEELGARADVSVIVLKGEGKSFSSGADLGYMKSMASFTLEQNQSDSNDLFAMFWAMRECNQPIVGRLHGHVMGGALGLASLCDVVGAVEGTQFCFSEVRLGLAPAVISPFILEKMNVAHARRYMLTAEVFGCSEALESGLVQMHGSESEVDSFVAQVVKALANNGQEALKATKSLIRFVSNESDWQLKRQATTRVIAERRVSAEGQEGLKSFFEKRSPSWRPKD